MRIACLAWGSLVWKTGPLKTSTAWQVDGPRLPVEFCRVDDKGELSTALCFGSPEVEVQWALLEATQLPVAREQLRLREGIPEDQARSVGSLPSRELDAHAAVIGDWAALHGVDAVVWTRLPPRFDGVSGKVPTPDEAVAYLDGLTGRERELAEFYIRHVPRQIATPIRAAIERRLGWTAEP